MTIFASYARMAAFAGVALLLSAVVAAPAIARLGDNDPHRAVSRAHQMPVQGIDVSQWQGDIDWNQVRQAGIDFAYIKATEGGDHLDPKFLQNWYGAKRAGIPRGAYHFVYWCRPAHEQALWFMLNVPNDPDALPPVLDVEWNGHSKTCPHKISKAKALEKIRIILRAMEIHTGMRPVIYTDPGFYPDVLHGELDVYPFWLRSTAAEPHTVYPGRKWSFWQFTTTGTVPGIRGNVDRNAFNGNKAAWGRVLQSIQAAK